jgi:glutaredoxin
MWNILILFILFVITGSSLYMIDKLFAENISIKLEGPLDTIEIFSDYIIVLAMENCPYCEILYNDYISKTNKKHTVITYKSIDKTFRFDTNFIDIPKQERENIIDEVDKFLKGPCTFPTIIHNKKITRGLVDKDLLNKIFT